MCLDVNQEKDHHWLFFSNNQQPKIELDFKTTIYSAEHHSYNPVLNFKWLNKFLSDFFYFRNNTKVVFTVLMTHTD